METDAKIERLGNAKLDGFFSRHGCLFREHTLSVIVVLHHPEHGKLCWKRASKDALTRKEGDF